MTEGATKLQYIVTSEAWYAAAVQEHVSYLDEVMFGRYCDGGGCKWEAAIRWYRIDRSVTARLEVYAYAWAAPEIAKVAEVLRALVPGPEAPSPSVAQVRAALEALGFGDRTERTRPNR